MLSVRTAPRSVAMALAATLVFPTMALTAGCGSKNNEAPPPVTTPTTPMNMPPNTMGGTMPGTAPKPGLSTKQKVVLLAGAALLFYIYKKDQANNAKAAQGTTAGGHPQLYREEKGPNTGAVYYRDPQTHQPVWVTAPSGGVNVPADQVQQYLPDYQQYQGQQVTVPAGARTVPATQYDPTLGQ